MKAQKVNDWKTVSLGECCEIVSGATPRRNIERYWDGDIPWVTPKDLSGLDRPVLETPPEFITAEGYASCSTTMLPPGSVLFSSRAPIGHVAIAGTEMCTNQGFKSLIPGSDVDSNYLYYVMKRMAPRIAAIGRGATFKEVSKEQMESFEIPLPPLDQQRRIASLLQTAEEIRRRRARAIGTVNDLLFSVFFNLFGNPVANEKGWKLLKLIDLVEEERPITYGILKPGPDLKGGVPYVRVLDMEDGQVKHDQVRRTSPEIHRQYRRSSLKPGDLLLSIRGHVGRLAIVPQALDGANITQDTARLAARSELCEPAFLYGCLSTPIYQNEMQRFVRGAAVKGINLGDIKNLVIPVPPLTLQKKFSDIVAVAHGVKNREKTMAIKGEELYGSLFQRAFAGDL